jgi:hypothetical protein
MLLVHKKNGLDIVGLRLSFDPVLYCNHIAINQGRQAGVQIITLAAASVFLLGVIYE